MFPDRTLTLTQTHARTPPACLHASESIIMLMSLQSPHVPTAYTLAHTHTVSAELSSIAGLATSMENNEEWTIS